MIRTLSAIAIALTLAACQPSGQGEAEPTAGQATLPSGDALPATYDWHFVAHGGSGDLDFGDGDWAEGVSVFGMSCLPQSKTVAMTWGYENEAVLTSGTATGTFQPGASAPTDHPVISALKASGAIDVGLGGADMRLAGKESGKGAIAAFFDYCDTGKDPNYSVEAAEAEDAAIAAAAVAPAVEAPAVEAPKT